MASEARLNVILTLVDRMTNNLKGVNRTLAQNQTLLRNVSIAAAAFSIAGVIALRSWARASTDSKVSLGLLIKVIEGTGASFGEFETPIDNAIKSLTKFSNYSRTEFQGALKDLILVLGEVPLAIAALGVTADVAAASGEDLGAAAYQVGKFMKGEIDTIRGVTGTIDKDITNPLERLAWLQKKVAGSALAALDPFKQLGKSLDELKEKLGKPLLDTLEPFVKALTDLTDKAKELDPLFYSIASSATLLATALVSIVAVLSGWLVIWVKIAPALALLGKAFGFLSGPIGAVALLIGAILSDLKGFQERVKNTIRLFKDFGSAIATWATETEAKWNKFLLDIEADWNLFWYNFKWPTIKWPDVSWKAWDDFWANFKLPEIKWPELHWPTLPEFKWPEIKLPEITWPELKWPEITLPEFKFPELSWGNILSTLKTAWDAFWNGLEIKLPLLPGISWGTILTDLETAWKVCLFNLEALRGIAATILKLAWDTFWPTLENAIDTLKTNVDPVWKAFMDGLGTIFKPAANAIIGLAEGMANGVIAAVNAMINALNRIQVPDWVWGIGGKGINISPVASVTIPRLAEGGIVTTPTLAMIGERGPEAVIPLGKGKGGGLTINFNGPVYGMDNFEKAVAQAVRNASLRGGFYGLKLGSNA